MRRVALKGLAWRKVRGVLTALSIVLGVAMVSGAFVVTDTMKKAADELESSSYAGIDGIVTGVAGFRDDNSWQKTPSISRVARRQGAGACRRSGTVDGLVLDQAKLVNAKGEVIGSAAELRVGIDAAQPGVERVNPLTLGSGRWATAGRRGCDRRRNRARDEHLGARRLRRRRRRRARCAGSRSSASSTGEISTRSARPPSPLST